jgi:hypothetical protein
VSSYKKAWADLNAFSQVKGIHPKKLVIGWNQVISHSRKGKTMEAVKENLQLPRP